MVQVLRLEERHYAAAIGIKEVCWKRDYGGFAPSEGFCGADELASLTAWIAHPGDDVRLLFGAHEDDDLIGFIGGSLADPADCGCGAEINYVFVRPECRGRGLGTLLVRRAVDEFHRFGLRRLVVYAYGQAERTNSHLSRPTSVRPPARQKHDGC